MTVLNLKQDDFRSVVASYSSKRTPDHRYTSFDYCYNYFQTTDDPLKDMEKSCLVLGFYLASWGMYRGSSSILQKSVKHLQSTIEYIVSQKDEAIWDIDVDAYNDATITEIIKVYNDVKDTLIRKDMKIASLTLVTKVLLGVFGFVPAFDSLFCSTFRTINNRKCGFRSISANALKCLKDFYDANESEIDTLSKNTFTIDFSTGKETNIRYPKAKIIDMYGFEFQNLRIK